MSIHFKGKNGPMLIAEIGGNHEGDAVYARELTKLAIQSDVDVIKYQIYSKIQKYVGQVAFTISFQINIMKIC